MRPGELRRADQHHRHDRLCRPVRPARGVPRAVMAQQPGRDADAQSRGAEEARPSTQTIVVASKPLRFGNELGVVVAARDFVAGRGASGRRIPQISDIVDAGGRRVVLTASSRTSRSCRPRSPGPASARRFGDAAGRHAGRHHPGQRRRRRRRLRAAGRSRRRRAHASEGRKRQQRPPPTSCCRTRACWRSTRSPMSATTSRRSPRRSRSRSIRPAAQKLSLAASVGTLSLMLRQVPANPRSRRRGVITLSDLTAGDVSPTQERSYATIRCSASARIRRSIVRITAFRPRGPAARRQPIASVRFDKPPDRTGEGGQWVGRSR